MKSQKQKWAQGPWPWDPLFSMNFQRSVVFLCMSICSFHDFVLCYSCFCFSVFLHGIRISTSTNTRTSTGTIQVLSTKY